ncbi:thiamine pyrophosphokinase, putative [Entamoeba invadens IP1]|uniref:Thiamine pyrophosphokinase, putative n=1 Tax=Entamoeba invadens IP1 TaxID=370355 RepID=A0A0A1U480_ENTIV|nr:thiamine pyrophosphokinase, putative [Entamoeba invadens IP1]ELP86496.1 thiamine pyrophosphokinase, putative [Entamoeba invadens IP1]|eukprot:XP_004185842.1 thiamine pyrophosphokinase, putative [Entamoeba invadens IP1]
MEKGKWCAIFTGGSYKTSADAIAFYQNIADNAEYLICADSGANMVHKIGRRPEIIVGDMDSIDKEVLEAYKDVEQVKYRCDKDYTDTEIAIGKARDRGYSEIVLCGGVGERFDHALGNAFSLIRLKRIGVHMRIVNYQQVIEASTETMIFEGRQGWTLSFIPVSERVENVTISGMQYPLVNKTLEIGVSLTISNVVTEDLATLNYTKGEMLVILTRPSCLA